MSAAPVCESVVSGCRFAFSLSDLLAVKRKAVTTAVKTSLFLFFMPASRLQCNVIWRAGLQSRLFGWAPELQCQFSSIPLGSIGNNVPRR